MTEPFADADRFRASIAQLRDARRAAPLARAAAAARAQPDADPGPLRARGPRDPARLPRAHGGGVPRARRARSSCRAPATSCSGSAPTCSTARCAGSALPRALAFDQPGGAAFQVATTRDPLAQRQPAAWRRSVTSAASGCPAARPRRTRLPSSVIETTSASRRFCAEPVRAASSGGSSAISHGIDAHRHRRRSPGRCWRPSRRRRASTRVRPSGPAPAVPVSTTAPVKSATNADARRGRELGRRCPPGPRGRASITPDAVAEQRRLGEVVRHEQRRHARPRAARRRSSRAALGAGARVERGQRLVEQQHVGPRASARASADALALAARQRAAAARRRAAPCRSARAARAPARGARRAAARAAGRRRSATRSGAGTARTPGRRSRSGAARAARSTPPRGVEPRLVAAAHHARARGAAGRRRRAGRWSCRRPTGPASARHSPAATSSATSSSSAPSRVARLNAEHRRAPPSPPTSFTDSRIAAETATSTADSASAPSKSVAKRS